MKSCGKNIVNHPMLITSTKFLSPAAFFN